MLPFADDVADGDGDECDGAKQDALDGSKDGAGTCNIQQVDQAVLPALHGDVKIVTFYHSTRGLPRRFAPRNDSMVLVR